MENKYHKILEHILDDGKMQANKKGAIKYLLNEQLTLSPADLLDIFESHGIARKKLKNALDWCEGQRHAKTWTAQEAGGHIRATHIYRVR